MKKTLALMLSIATVMTMAMSALAATDASIVLGNDKDSDATLEKALLQPGEEYRYPLSLNGEAVTEDVLDNYRVKITNKAKEKGVDEIKLVKLSGVYYLSVLVKDGFPAEQTEEEYTIKFNAKSSSNPDAELKVAFDTGYAFVDDAVIGALELEDEVELDNDTPVFRKEQLEKIARVNNYRNITFAGDNWTYKANVTDMPNANLFYDNKAIEEVLNNYPENSFEFLRFPGTPTFTTAGIIELEVDGLSEQFMQTFYVYKYSEGRLIPMAASYNHEDDILSIQSKSLGHFVITDKKIANTTVTVPTEGSGEETKTPEVINPNTGAAA